MPVLLLAGPEKMIERAKANGSMVPFGGCRVYVIGASPAGLSEIRNDSDGQCFILLNSGAQLPLSRRRRSEVHRAIERFSGRALSTSQ
jgi:hypothetical protein